MTWLSASGVPRALACAASLALPRHKFASPDADAGTERHADAENAIDTGAAEDVLPARVVAMIREDDEVQTERGFAYDCAADTGRDLGHVTHRQYPTLAPFEIPGTADLVIVGGGRAIVVDKKGFLKVGPAETNEQTMTLALGVARHYGLQEVTVVIFYEIGGTDVAVIGSLDLDVHAERLRELQFAAVRARTALLAGTIADLAIPGAHCSFCESFLSCPKKSAEVIEVGSAEMAVRVESSIPFEDDEEAARAFDLLGRIKMLAQRIESALYARAGERQFRLRDGRVFGARDKQGNREIDADAAYQLIRERYGQKVADASVKRKVAQKWIEDALKANGIAAPGATKDKLVKELETAGHVKREVKQVVEVYEPGPKLLKDVG